MTFECSKRKTPGCNEDCTKCPLMDQCMYCENARICFKGTPGEKVFDTIRGKYCNGGVPR